MSKKKFEYVLIMPVWGDHHTGLMLRYGVPFLLTDGNVGAFPNRELRIVMMSRRADIARMRQNADYRRLAELVDLAEVEIDEIIDLSIPHRAMTNCYLHAVRELKNPDNTVTIFPTPDCFLSRSALQEIVTRMEAGWRGIMICGLRTTLETIGPLLDEALARPQAAQGVSERELTSMVLKTLHPITLGCDVQSEEFMAGWPSHVYWVAPDRTWLIAHCFHLHPIAVLGVPKHIDINTTIDGDYLLGLGITADQLFVCQDSDEFICAEISPSEKRIHTTLGRFTRRAVLRFSVSQNFLHKQFYQPAIHWRGVNASEIPATVLAETEQLKTAVAKGSNFEEFRAWLIALVRRTPVLLFSLRLTLWGIRRLKRLVGVS